MDLAKVLDEALKGAGVPEHWRVTAGTAIKGVEAKIEEFLVEQVTKPEPQPNPTLDDFDRDYHEVFAPDARRPRGHVHTRGTDPGETHWAVKEADPELERILFEEELIEWKTIHSQIGDASERAAQKASNWERLWRIGHDVETCPLISMDQKVKIYAVLREAFNLK